MDIRFLPHNSHLQAPELFAERDPQLRNLGKMPFVHNASLIDELPTDIVGIYTLRGGRQVGKSTLLKQWMLTLLEKGVDPNTIVFFSGELIDDHHALLRLIQSQLNEMPAGKMKYLIVDEVTYIAGWDKTIKYFADAGLLEDVVLMLTGSDLVMIQEARMRFPGRRGQAAKVDFHLHALSFNEAVRLKKGDAFVESSKSGDKNTLEDLYQEFDAYLQHGGYLTAINDIARYNEILPATLNTYSDWIRGDMLKRGKQEHYLNEILTAMIKRYGSQVTWNSLAHDLSIDHPATVNDYIQHLALMDVLFIQSALQENTLRAAPKKARKLVCLDPFIYHAIQSWIKPTKMPYREQILTAVSDPIVSAQLVEAAVVTHFSRKYPTYYIKAEGEVDIAYVERGQFWPIEIKWTNQLRPKDLKQVLKYKNSRIFAKTKEKTQFQHIAIEPLPVALMNLDLGRPQFEVL